MDEYLIFGGSKDKFAIGEQGVAGWRGQDCNIVIVREASQEEYLNYLLLTNRKPEPNHGPYYYAAVGD